MVARINTSLSKDDHGYSSMCGAAPINSNDAVPDDSPGTSPHLLDIFADPTEAAATHKYHHLNNELAKNQHSLARHEMRALEETFPHLNFTEILRIALTIFPEYFDHVSGASAPNTGL